MAIKFSSLPKQSYQSEHENRWISQKLTDGKFGYYFIIEILEEENFEKPLKYLASLCISSPERLKECNLKIVKKYLLNTKLNEETLADTLDLNGISLSITTIKGTNRKNLLKTIKQKAQEIAKSIKSYTINWKFLKGDILCDIYSFS